MNLPINRPGDAKVGRWAPLGAPPKGWSDADAEFTREAEAIDPGQLGW